MRILKISDGFVTNSSSDNAIIIIAVKKHKQLSDYVEKFFEIMKIMIFKS